MRIFLPVWIFLFAGAVNCNAQDWLWSTGVSGWSDARPEDMKLDAAGDLLICGSFESTLQLPVGTFTHQATTTAHCDAFLAKYDVNGNCIWAKSFGGRMQDYFMSLDINSQGEIIVAGTSWSDTLILGNDTLFCTGAYNSFVAKFDSTGNPIWVRSGGGSMSDIPYSIAVDDSDNIYVAGESTSSTVTFGPYTINGGYFLLKYDTQGNIIWARDRQGGGWKGASDLVIDNQNDIIVVGQCPWGSVFGSYNIGLNTMFIAKYSPTGNVLWAKGLDSNGDANAYSVCVDDSNNIYMSGTFRGTSCSFGSLNIPNLNSVLGDQATLFASCDSAGNERWLKGFALGAGLCDYDMPNRLDYRDNKIYLTGQFGIDTLTIDTFAIPNLGTYEIYIAAFSTLGNVIFTVHAGNYSTDLSLAIECDSLDNVYITGWTSQGIFGIYQQHFPSFFVAKYGPIIPPQCNFLSGAASVCAGDSVSFFDLTMNAPSSWNWSFPGGTPSASNLQNPILHYNTPGIFDVQLIVSNGAGADTLFYPNMINVNGLPLPVITYSGDTLVSSYANGNQWFRNMWLIPGANQQRYLPTQAGNYTVAVWDSTCISMSLPVTSTVGIHEVQPGIGVAITPNPAINELTLTSFAETNSTWTMYDALGNIVLTGTLSNSTAKINLEGLRSGIYWIATGTETPQRFVKISE